ncbi:MAG: hypothetical protein JNK10_09000 [Cyclobacteriaceae bacterium]|nr:hypothetical protein [Cyclobacteriaceae bacterium]
MVGPIIGDVLGFARDLIGRLIPDPLKRQVAENELKKLDQSGALEEMRTRYGAIMAEAQSADPWTSRARPAFLYVVYVLILSSLPYAVLYACSPSAAGEVVVGFKAWLEAIPEPLYVLMGIGYSGYTLSRSYEKIKIK